MDTYSDLSVTDDVGAILQNICSKGVDLWLEDGRVHYKAPRGALTQDDIERLKAYKSRIAAFLQSTTTPSTLPLAFSQLAHWNLHNLGEHRVLRGVSTALRLRGSIEIDLLRRSVAETIRRHTALRTRIVVNEGVPYQSVLEEIDCELRVHDLTFLRESRREAEQELLIRKCLFERVDVTRDCLFKAWVLRIHDDEHVLILAMEHIISDGVSLNILLRDIFESYLRGLGCGDVYLPDPATQFIDHAVSQRSGHTRWIAEHLPYWNARLAGCKRLRLPRTGGSESALGGLGLLPLRIDRELTARLRRWCRLNRTTLVMCMFAAYIGFVLRYCNVSEAVFLNQTDGRFDTKLQDTIGYLAVRLCLRVELRDDDRLLDLINRVTEEYCNAHEHADYSFIDTQNPRPEFMRNTCFNWAVRDVGHLELDTPLSRITASEIPLDYRVVDGVELDAEPVLGLYEDGEEILGQFQFPLRLFSADAMAVIWDDFMAFVQALLDQPDGCVSDISIGGSRAVSDRNVA